MCGRYSLFKINELNNRYDAYQEFEFDPNYNIAPGTVAPVITRNSPNKIELMKWGLIPFWAKDPRIGYKMINARAEGIENKPAFRKPIGSQRCLVPTNGFFEWKRLNLEGKEEKIPWFIELKDVSIFSLAGLYDVWHDSEGVEIRSFTIITTTPNSFVKNIHNRMPVILSQTDENMWLDASTPLKDVVSLLKPINADLLIGHPVSQRVNDPENNDPGILSED